MDRPTFPSLAVSFRLGLAFHALNNEGTEGTNVLYPRQVEVAGRIYDGISGAIQRRHVLENLVGIARREGLPLLPFSEELEPDRWPLGIRYVAKTDLDTQTLDRSILYRATRKALERCVVLDAGGGLAAWKEGSTRDVVIEEKWEGKLASVGDAPNVKRDSVFDLAWMISEAPQEKALTQHAAYRPSGEQSLYHVTMRSNVYGGVFRAALHRLGTDDYWHLQEDAPREILKPQDKLRRMQALVEAFFEFLTSPRGAKEAAWCPHLFLLEGAAVFRKNGTAPFVSPIKVDLSSPEAPVKPREDFLSALQALAREGEIEVFIFRGPEEAFGVRDQILKRLEESHAG
ncbi:MAG: DevR family CRISPR-associated autoregulator [Thermodesulfatator sp.]|nr:MAG: DevR family CRISPR-associated autoregulator [Thermodesulfatator sp.]